MLVTLGTLALALGISTGVGTQLGAQEEPPTTSTTVPPSTAPPSTAPPSTAPGATAPPSTATPSTAPATSPPAAPTTTPTPAPPVAGLEAIAASDPGALVSSGGEVRSSAEIESAGAGTSLVRSASGKPAWASPRTVDGTPLPGATAAQSDVGTQSIIGPDGRVRINPTTTYPYRAVTHVTLRFGSAGYSCSGWLIGPDTAVTAGHCVFDGAVWANTVRVYPGRNGPTVAPYGGCSARSGGLYTSAAWIDSQSEFWDYGIIKLNCKVGNTTGWFGFFKSTALSTVGTNMTVSGYPGDKTYGTQWRMTGPITGQGVYQLFYQMDTFAGQSGGPVWRYHSSCGWCGGAIHTYGLHGTGAHASNNHGTRIGSTIFNAFVSVKNAP